MNIESKKLEESLQVHIADEVIGVIAEIALLETEGVYSIFGKNDIVQTIRGKKIPKGIKIEVVEDKVFITITCIVKYGVKIHDVCLKVQDRVKNSVETMTGLEVKNIDIFVQSIDLPKEEIIERNEYDKTRS